MLTNEQDTGLIPRDWRRALGSDVTAIMDLTRVNFRHEATDLWTIDEQHFAHCLTTDIVHQFYNPKQALVAVNVTAQGQLLAYVWVKRGIKTVWSSDEMITVELVHLDLRLPARQRIGIIKDMIYLWELWAWHCGVPMVVSSTMRGDQSAFLKLHQRHGYTCRGSICYKRIIAAD